MGVLADLGASPHHGCRVYAPKDRAPSRLAGGASRDSDAEVEVKQAALKELFAQADPVQQQLLCKIGLSSPPVKKPSIMELLQKDLDNLPVQLKEAVLEAVEPEIPKPEGPVAPQSAIASAAKAYKSAAVELKDLTPYAAYSESAAGCF